MQALQLAFEVDPALNVFSSISLSTGFWTAYRMNLKIGNVYNINIVDVTAHYQGKENVFIEPDTTNRAAEKIRFDITISTPDAANITAPPIVQKYITTGWFVENIGLVKLEGNGLLINTLSGGGIDFADTSRSIRQEITSYNIN
jgi:hypothetical protein